MFSDILMGTVWALASFADYVSIAASAVANSYSRQWSYRVSAHIRVIGLDLWSPRFKEGYNVQWNCFSFYRWNWSLERRAVFLQRKIHNIFLREIESDLVTGGIYKLTLLRKLVKNMTLSSTHTSNYFTFSSNIFQSLKIFKKWFKQVDKMCEE